MTTGRDEAFTQHGLPTSVAKGDGTTTAAPSNFHTFGSSASFSSKLFLMSITVYTPRHWYTIIMSPPGSTSLRAFCTILTIVDIAMASATVWSLSIGTEKKSLAFSIALPHIDVTVRTGLVATLKSERIPFRMWLLSSQNYPMTKSVIWELSLLLIRKHGKEEVSYDVLHEYLKMSSKSLLGHPCLGKRRLWAPGSVIFPDL